MNNIFNTLIVNPVAITRVFKYSSCMHNVRDAPVDVCVSHARRCSVESRNSMRVSVSSPMSIKLPEMYRLGST